MDHSDHNKPLDLHPVIPAAFVLKAEHNRSESFLNFMGENGVASCGSVEQLWGSGLMANLVYKELFEVPAVEN